MVSYRERTNGWEYRISYKAPDGSYARLEKGGFRNKTAAKAAAAQAEVDLSKGIVEDKNITLANYFENWALIHKKSQVDPTTFEKYTFTLKVIKEYYRDTKLSKITATMHQRVLNELADRYVRETIKLINSHIRQSIKIALHEGSLKRDFTELAKIYSNIDSKDEELKYLEMDEYFSLLENSRKAINYQSHFFIYLVGKTGLRFSEAQGLTIDDIDYENMCLNIHRTYKVYGRDKGWKKTKNPQSVRKVPIDKDVVQAIAEYLQVGYKENDDRRLLISASNNAVNKLLKKRTEKEFTAHGLRHTYVSFLIANDVNVVTIANLIGHKDATETLKTYAHLFSQKQAEDFSRVRNLFENFGA